MSGKDQIIDKIANYISAEDLDRTQWRALQELLTEAGFTKNFNRYNTHDGIPGAMTMGDLCDCIAENPRLLIDMPPAKIDLLLENGYGAALTRTIETCSDLTTKEQIEASLRQQAENALGGKELSDFKPGVYSQALEEAQKIWAVLGDYPAHDIDGLIGPKTRAAYDKNTVAASVDHDHSDHDVPQEPSSSFEGLEPEPMFDPDPMFEDTPSGPSMNREENTTDTDINMIGISDPFAPSPLPGENKPDEAKQPAPHQADFEEESLFGPVKFSPPAPQPLRPQFEEAAKRRIPGFLVPAEGMSLQDYVGHSDSGRGKSWGDFGVRPVHPVTRRRNVPHKGKDTPGYGAGRPILCADDAQVVGINNYAGGLGGRSYKIRFLDPSSSVEEAESGKPVKYSNIYQMGLHTAHNKHKVGDFIKQGDAVARVGSKNESGIRSKGAHMHIEYGVVIPHPVTGVMTAFSVDPEAMVMLKDKAYDPAVQEKLVIFSAYKTQHPKYRGATFNELMAKNIGMDQVNWDSDLIRCKWIKNLPDEHKPEYYGEVPPPPEPTDADRKAAVAEDRARDQETVLKNASPLTSFIKPPIPLGQ